MAARLQPDHPRAVAAVPAEGNRPVSLQPRKTRRDRRLTHFPHWGVEKICVTAVDRERWLCKYLGTNVVIT